MPKLDAYELKNKRAIEAVKKEIEAIYAKIAAEVGRVGVGIGDIPKDKPFDLNKYPLAKKRIEALIAKLAKELNIEIKNGINYAWELANDKNDKLVKKTLAEVVAQMTESQKAIYFARNLEARDAFLARKVSGMNLSQRVWQYAQQAQGMIESTLELGIKEGESAAVMARNLKQYLQYPDKLFRRVRDKKGKLHLSKRAAAFHPGVGINRSSYKNALRLAATEINMAYRTSDFTRYSQLDFVVGIRIQLSNNHTLNGKPFHDICDDLKGDYPKWFKFVGWHPLCRCYVTSILKTIEETKRDLDGIDRGSVNEVKDLPPQFKQWATENEERIYQAEGRGTLPYFIRDNREAVMGLFGEGAENAVSSSTTPRIRTREEIWQAAEERHANRTEFEVLDIRKRWFARSMADDIPEAYKMVIAQNWLDIEEGSGKVKGRPMSIEKADSGKTNPLWDMDYDHSYNCATCAAAYTLRRFGFDFLARGRKETKHNDWVAHGHSFDIWENPDGTQAIPERFVVYCIQNGYKQMSRKRFKKFFDEKCASQGIYVVTEKLKGGSGHATILERDSEGNLWYVEPQWNDEGSLEKYPLDWFLYDIAMKQPSQKGVMRVDNKVFKTEFLDLFR